MSAANYRAFLVLGGLLAVSAPAQSWVELGDAPSFPDGSAQVTRGAILDTIEGSTGVGDLRDAFCIIIADPEGFLATTDPAISPTANADYDTRLFLFRSDGAPVLANDDTPSGISEQSTLTGVATDGSGFVLSQPGEYVLIVGGSPEDPQDPSDLELFDIDSDLDAVHGPDPASGRFDHWEGETPDTGSYEVLLSGVRPCQDQLDLVLANRGQRDRVCLGDDSGGFACQNLSGDEDRTKDLALGFLNKDPHLDVVLADQSSVEPEWVCLGNGAGRFTCNNDSGYQSSKLGVALGFVDDDQHLDAVFASEYLQTNKVCLGDGIGGFTCGDVSDDAFGSGGVALGFINGDKNLDAVFANYVFDRNRVCLGNGAGAFSCSDVSDDANGSSDVALGYVNDDQDLDAIFGNWGQTDRVCLGNGSGGFSCADVSSDEWNTSGVALGFVDSDSNLDAVFAINTLEEDRVCLGDGTGGFACSDVSSDIYQSSDVALGFVDDDPYLDAVFANRLEQRNRICLGNGTGGFVCSDVSSLENNTLGGALGETNSLVTIFADGFESGDTTAWSAQQPPP